MDETDIGKLMSWIHGDFIEDHKLKWEYNNKLFELCKKLQSSSPLMNLMFSKKHEYSISMPGYFSIPMNFKID